MSSYIAYMDPMGWGTLVTFTASVLNPCIQFAENPHQPATVRSQELISLCRWLRNMARASVRPTASFSTGSKKQANNKDRRESGCQEASKPTSKDKKTSRKQAEHKQNTSKNRQLATVQEAPASCP